MIVNPSFRDFCHCPGRELLEALSLGQLHGDVRDEIERHVECCCLCVASLEAIDDSSDPLIADLRASGEPRDSEIHSNHRWTSSEGIASGDTGFNGSQDPNTEPPGRIDLSKQMGDYRFDEALGQGGMGTVYRAIHTRLGKVVALKVIQPNRMGDPESLARFRREMRALGSLEHPNLVRAYDAREEAGVPFLVMEYVDGIDLARLLRRMGRLSIADACAVVRQAATGLDYAHRSHGLVHRDIKPSNLMITSGGCVKILDLGIARFDSSVRGREFAPDSCATEIAERIGTYDYMAPEQWLMSPEVDIRTDVYGLGCTLYELLLGRAPYARPEWTTWDEKMRAHTLIPPPPVLECRSDIPDSLSEVLNRMLAKCPADRYETPAKVIEALEPFVTGHNLAALLSTTPFIPTLSHVTQLAASDQPIGHDPEGSTGIFKRWKQPRAWSIDRSKSKPMAVSAVLMFATLLLLVQTITGNWPGPNASPSPIRGALQNQSTPTQVPIIRTEELVQAELAIRLYRIRKSTDELYDMGRIGDPRDGPQGTASIDLKFVVEASFAEPLFPYLISIDQAGTRDLEFPEGEAVVSTRKKFKSPSGNIYLSLEKEGLLGLILVGSRRPLSSTESLALLTVQSDDWQRSRTDVPWLFDGERCEPLVRDREGGFRRVSHGPKPFSDACSTLRSHPEIAAIRAIAFPVTLAPKSP